MIRAYRKRAAVLFFAALVILLFALSGYAQKADTKYPSRPINFIVPFSPGGSTDLAVRLIAKEAERYLGQPLVVVNKPGGGGSVGLATVVVAKPDGYTIGQSPGGAPLFIMPFLEKLPYDPVKDIRYVMQFVELNFGILVKGDSPFKSLRDLLDYGRQNPGKMIYGTNAPNSISNLIVEQVARKENIQTKHIPFKASPEYQTAVLGGHILFAVGDFNYSLVDSGELRLLAYLSEKRAAAYPQVPTLKELGYDIPCPVFLGVMAPKGTPDEIVRKLEDAFGQSMRQPAFINGIKDLRLTTNYRNSKELTEYVSRNYDMFARLIKELGLTK
ncbi:MAG TPA: tripartite tricarboxylate transporter substrate binding protein [Syntrophorhabdales bacterium]|nr:tripartite tricarboxylate transporter substrate binding protein [Syntrophorhabdales bacterium]